MTGVQTCALPIFISSNPGLQSRFNKYMFFPDYNGDELMAMFRSRVKKNGYTLTEDADAFALELFQDMYENRDDNFGNGRDVRNRFEDVISRQANRLAEMESPSKDDLMTIIKADLLTPEEMAEFEAEANEES